MSTVAPVIRKSNRKQAAEQAAKAAAATAALSTPVAPGGAASSAAAAIVPKRSACMNAASSRNEKQGIKDTDLDLVSDDLYEKLQEEVVMELLEGLRSELTPVYEKAVASSSRGATSMSSAASSSALSACESDSSAPQDDLLWNVVATPAMMRAFSQQVAASHSPREVSTSC